MPKIGNQGVSLWKIDMKRINYPKCRKPRAPNDITGQKFNKLTALEVVDKKWDSFRWKCACDCGNTTLVPIGALRSGNTKSCGCLRDKIAGDRFRVHGFSHKSKTYETWRSMRERCNNPKNKSYKNYGQRGITVCERWNNYLLFLADMGEKPDGMTLERVNNAIGYTPSNCIWADRETQANNKRSNKIVTVGEISLTMAQWAAITGIPYTRIQARLRRGWDATRAVSK